MWEADDSQDLWATPGNSPAASMAHGERMVGSELTAEDLDVDRTLRPQRLDDYCGQEHIKQSLRVLIEAAQSRGETLDHVIFSGPPGLGKTTLATVIANELGAQIKTTSGPAIARTGDLAAILTNLQPGDVLFIDEVHRLPRTVEEILYPAMEDFALDIITGKGQMQYMCGRMSRAAQKRNPGRGSQRLHRALGGTRILLAAAPTAPPCFCRWQRSSLLLFESTRAMSLALLQNKNLSALAYVEAFWWSEAT